MSSSFLLATGFTGVAFPMKVLVNDTHIRYGTNKLTKYHIRGVADPTNDVVTLINLVNDIDEGDPRNEFVITDASDGSGVWSPACPGLYLVSVSASIGGSSGYPYGTCQLNLAVNNSSSSLFASRYDTFSLDHSVSVGGSIFIQAVVGSQYKLAILVNSGGFTLNSGNVISFLRLK